MISFSVKQIRSFECKCFVDVVSVTVVVAKL